jgi:hypothetical protein
MRPRFDPPPAAHVLAREAEPAGGETGVRAQLRLPHVRVVLIVARARLAAHAQLHLHPQQLQLVAQAGAHVGQARQAQVRRLEALHPAAAVGHRHVDRHRRGGRRELPPVERLGAQLVPGGVAGHERRGDAGAQRSLVLQVLDAEHRVEAAHGEGELVARERRDTAERLLEQQPRAIPALPEARQELGPGEDEHRRRAGLIEEIQAGGVEQERAMPADVH